MRAYTHTNTNTHTHTHTRIYEFRIAVYARDFVCVSEKSFSLSHSVARAKPFGNGHGIKFPLSALVHIYPYTPVRTYTRVYIYV